MKLNIRIAKSWYDIPLIWKYVPEVKKVKYGYTPDDKGLKDIMMPFVSNDDLRPAMTGIYFDKKAIVATDAHRMLIMPNNGSKVTGIFDPETGKKIDATFPNYEFVLTDYPIKTYFNIQIDKLKSFLNVVLKGKYSNEVTKMVRFYYKDNSGEEHVIGFNAEFLVEMLDAFDKIYGDNFVNIAIKSPSKGVYFARDASVFINIKKEIGYQPIGLLMPQIVTLYDDPIEPDVFRFSAADVDIDRQISVLYDLQTGNIINEDGTIVQWKPVTEPIYQILSKDKMQLLKRFARENQKNLPILQYFHANNGEIYAFDGANWLQIENIDLDDGLYQIINNAICDVNESVDNFPVFKITGNLVSGVYAYRWAEDFIQASEFAKKEKNWRYNQECVNLVYDKENGYITISATDNFVYYKKSVSVSPTSSPSFFANLHEYILVSKFLGYFSGKPDPIRVVLYADNVERDVISPKWISFSGDEMVMYTPAEDHDFPNIQQILPKYTTALKISRDSLKTAYAGIKGRDKKEDVLMEPYGGPYNYTLDLSLFKDDERQQLLIHTHANGSNIPDQPENFLAFQCKNKNIPYDGWLYEARFLKAILDVTANDEHVDFYSVSFGGIVAVKLNEQGYNLKRTPNAPKQEPKKKAEPKPKKEKPVPEPAPEPVNKEKEKLLKALAALETLAAKGNKSAMATVEGIKLLLKTL